MQHVCEIHRRLLDGRDKPSAEVARSGDHERVGIVAPGGWRVVPLVVERSGQTLRLYRVTRHGVFVCECRNAAEVAATGVPLGELVEDENGQTATPPAD